MDIFTSVRSELVKLRHTPHLAVHIFVPLIGTVLFAFYFIIYDAVNEAAKLKLILELTAMVYPLLVCVIVGINIMQEEMASHFQNILCVPSRKRMLTAKILVLYLSGDCSLLFLYAAFLFAICVNGVNASLVMMLIKGVLGLAFCSLHTYILHLFLCLKFGMGISFFCSICECLQCVLYSNIEMQSLWRYNPFAWSVNWINDIFHNRLSEHIGEWIIIAILSIAVFLVVVNWFSHWEGRKNYD